MTIKKYQYIYFQVAVYPPERYNLGEQMANKDTQQQLFGGSWTQKKLECLSKYLSAYTTIFNRNPGARYYETTYLDAFAGTGRMPSPDIPFTEIFSELTEGVEDYQKGSVVRALEVQPGFDHYIFIEQDKARYAELEKVKQAFPRKDIHVENADANEYLKNWCAAFNPQKSRAVLFLDPFGMSVDWEVIELIAKTKAVDFWILFPIFAVNRMLIRDKRPPESWRKRLTAAFGTDEWEQQFYKTRERYSLLDSDIHTQIEKDADYDKIGHFFVGRLKTIFINVAEPLVLRNSKNSPLYLFCFAAGNPKGAATAVKIAKDIIGN